MAKANSAAQVIKKIGKPHLNLYRGNGYWYFVFDDGTDYQDRSIATCYLYDLSLERWIEEGRDFLKDILPE